LFRRPREKPVKDAGLVIPLLKGIVVQRFLDFLRRQRREGQFRPDLRVD